MEARGKLSYKSLRIVFMGSPGFAVEPLKELIEAGCNVVAVLTAPDRPAGRGKKIRQSAVKEYLLQNHPSVPVLQPEKLKDPAFIKELAELKPDLQVVVAFRMLPELVWRIPTLGTFNLHASLLPQYRGAAPINHALINGEKETGVTTFLIDEQIDTGRILVQERTSIGEKENAGELHDRLMVIGAGLVLGTVKLLAEGSTETQEQTGRIRPDEKLMKAPKIFREDCLIRWEQTGREIFNLIRGLSPYPASFASLKKEAGSSLSCKIFSADFEALAHNITPGTILTDSKHYLKVAVKDGFIEVLSIQQEGKRKMDTRDFLAGTQLTNEQSRFS
jgi:methionyl-tRNA formyltransferase